MEARWTGLVVRIISFRLVTEKELVTTDGAKVRWRKDQPCKPGESFIPPFQYQMLLSLFHSSSCQMYKVFEVLWPATKFMHWRE